MDATEVPVRIKDELPEGAIATSAKAIAGVVGWTQVHGPVDCEVKAPDEVLCSFEGTLPPYESIEVEVFTSLQGSPPTRAPPARSASPAATLRPPAAPRRSKSAPTPSPTASNASPPKPKKRAAA